MRRDPRPGRAADGIRVSHWIAPDVGGGSATDPVVLGINGAAGVLSAILAVACSIAFGIGVTLLLGAACYLLADPRGAMVIGFHRGAG